MMRITLSIAFLAALSVPLSVPLSAQQMGSTNRGAQKIEQEITFDNGAELSIEYTALNWAAGKFMENVKQERFRTMVNDNAKQNPAGKLELSQDMTIGGKPVKAGEYGLHFMISDDAAWMLTLSQTNADGELVLIQWPLELEDSPIQTPRLLIALAAGDTTTNCTLHLMFGNKYVAMPAALTEKE